MFRIIVDGAEDPGKWTYDSAREYALGRWLRNQDAIIDIEWLNPATNAWSRVARFWTPT